jgi:transcriptional regulator with XRE-family HTH domain
MVFVTTVGRHLRDARTACKMSQEAVAAALGLSQSAVSQLDRGIIPSRYRTLAEYAGLVGADLSLIDRELLRSLPTLRRGRHPLAWEIGASQDDESPAAVVQGEHGLEA